MRGALLATTGIAALIFASLYMQKVLGFSPVASGLALVPSTLTIVLVHARHGGSLVDGYRLSFLIATGLAVLTAITVALQLSSKSRRCEPGQQQAGPGGPPPAPAQLGRS